MIVCWPRPTMSSIRSEHLLFELKINLSIPAKRVPTKREITPSRFSKINFKKSVSWGGEWSKRRGKALGRVAGGKFTERQGRTRKRQTLLTSHFHVGQALTPGQPPSLKVSLLRSSHSIFWKDTKYSFVGLLSYKHFPVAALSRHHPWAQVESWSSEARASILMCRLPIRLHDLYSHTWHPSPSVVTTLLIPFERVTKRKGAVENWLQ